MGKQPFVSHAVNGYSRYDMPENKAFSVTPGIIYPVRIQFVNARDRVTLHQGVDVRSNPLGVPSFPCSCIIRKCVLIRLSSI